MNHQTKHRKNLTGQKLGLLTVIEYAGTTGNARTRKATWRCRCDCGTVLVSQASPLLRGIKTHCGCQRVYWSAKRGCFPRGPYKITPKVKLLPEPKPKPVVPEPVKVDPIEIARMMRKTGAPLRDIAEYLECGIEEAKALLAGKEAA